MKGRLPKKWGFDSLQIYGGRGGAWQERGVVFLRGSCYPNAHCGQQSLVEQN